MLGELHVAEPLMVMLSGEGEGVEASPVTLAVKLYVPLTVGVPLTTPAELSDMPGGKLPPEIDQLGVPAPQPLVVSCTVGVYAVLIVPACSGLDVVFAQPLNVSVIGLFALETNVWFE